MKICQLCTVDFTLHHFLVPLMEAMRDAGHEVVGVCADGPMIAQVRMRQLHVETVPLARSLNPLLALRTTILLYRLFRRERFDLVHVHTPAAAFPGRIAAALAGVPRVVYTAHGFYFHEHMPRLKRALFIALEWLAGRFTHTLFTQSGEDAEDARRLGLCRTGDILAIGNGSDPQRFHPPADEVARQKLRTKFGAGDRPVIVMIGRLVTEKGYPELLAAMAEVDADLWIVGERLPSDHAGPVDSLIDGIAEDASLRSRIHFLGYREDVPDLLRAADIFVLPSHREGMPRSIIEAMLTGLPVVATNIRGSREEVVDEGTGLLVPVGDPAALAFALNRLAADPALRRKLGAAGLLLARDRFDEARVVSRQLVHLRLCAT